MTSAPGTSDRLTLDTSRPEVCALLAQLLAGGTAILIRVTGCSMRPFLQGGEVVEVRPVRSGAIRYGDLVLARQAGGALLMHRVLWIRRESGGVLRLQTIGDAAPYPDPAVGTVDVLGRVCAVVRDRPGGAVRRIDLNSLPWRLYGCVVVARQLARLVARRVSARIQPHRTSHSR